MDWQKRWEFVREIGRGGQATVSLVLDKEHFDRISLFKDLKTAVQRITSVTPQSEYDKAFDLFMGVVERIADMKDSSFYALKKIHDPKDKDAADPEHAAERIKREIQAMASVKHPHIIRTVDRDRDDHRWYVSEYFPKGTLHQNLGLFKGDVESAVKAFRPLVDAVAHIHRIPAGRIIHRDIKPKNIFINKNSELILGDFGIVLFADEDLTRLTNEFVGSKDWMPPWIYGRTIPVDQIPHNFDVFCLAKVLWAMIAGKPMLPNEDFEDPQFNVEVMFPTARFIKVINPLLKKCIVRKEKDCLADAQLLLQEVDQILDATRGTPAFNIGNNTRCRACGIGQYHTLVDRDPAIISRFGMGGDAEGEHKVHVCDHCGHVALFFFPRGQQSHRAWSGLNLALLVQKLNQLVRLRPVARSFRSDGTEVFPLQDSQWAIVEHREQAVQIQNTSTNDILHLVDEDILGFRAPDIVLLTFRPQLYQNEIKREKLDFRQNVFADPR